MDFKVGDKVIITGEVWKEYKNQRATVTHEVDKAGHYRVTNEQIALDYKNIKHIYINWTDLRKITKLDKALE